METVAPDRPGPTGTACAARREPDPPGTRSGGTSQIGTPPGTSFPDTPRERSSGPSLTAGCVVRLDRYYDRLRLPPGARSTPRSTPVIGQAVPRKVAVRFGRAGPPQFSPPLSERSAPLTPGSPSRLHLPGSSPLPWPSPSAARLGSPSISTDAAGFTRVTDRSVCVPRWGFRRWLRPDPIPDQAASLLPGLLTTTRTGLTRASDDRRVLRSRHDLSNHLLITGRTACDRLSSRRRNRVRLQ
jgi:hypothetical protein